MNPPRDTPASTIAQVTPIRPLTLEDLRKDIETETRIVKDAQALLGKVLETSAAAKSEASQAKAVAGKAEAAAERAEAVSREVLAELGAVRRILVDQSGALADVQAAIVNGDVASADRHTKLEAANKARDAAIAAAKGGGAMVAAGGLPVADHRIRRRRSGRDHRPRLAPAQSPEAPPMIVVAIIATLCILMVTYEVGRLIRYKKPDSPWGIWLTRIGIGIRALKRSKLVDRLPAGGARELTRAILDSFPDSDPPDAEATPVTRIPRGEP